MGCCIAVNGSGAPYVSDDTQQDGCRHMPKAKSALMLTAGVASGVTNISLGFATALALNNAVNAKSALDNYVEAALYTAAASAAVLATTILGCVVYSCRNHSCKDAVSEGGILDSTKKAAFDVGLPATAAISSSAAVLTPIGLLIALGIKNGAAADPYGEGKLVNAEAAMETIGKVAFSLLATLPIAITNATVYSALCDKIKKSCQKDSVVVHTALGSLSFLGYAVYKFLL